MKLKCIVNFRTITHILVSCTQECVDEIAANITEDKEASLSFGGQSYSMRKCRYLIKSKWCEHASLDTTTIGKMKEINIILTFQVSQPFLSLRVEIQKCSVIQCLSNNIQFYLHTLWCSVVQCEN